MDQVRILNMILALTTIVLNIRWWRKPVNRMFGEIIIPPIMISLLVIGFYTVYKLMGLNVEILNGISLGIRSLTLITFMLYAATRKDSR